MTGIEATRDEYVFTDEENAAHTVVSPFTAKTHVSRAMTKPGARDRQERR